MTALITTREREHGHQSSNHKSRCEAQARCCRRWWGVEWRGGWGWGWFGLRQPDGFLEWSRCSDRFGVCNRRFGVGRRNGRHRDFFSDHRIWRQGRNRRLWSDGRRRWCDRKQEGRNTAERIRCDDRMMALRARSAHASPTGRNLKQAAAGGAVELKGLGHGQVRT